MEVESCLALSIGALDRNLLHSNKQGEPKSGVAYITSKYTRLLIGYAVILGDPFKLKIIYPYKGNPKSQIITLMTKPVGFGEKPFFFCVMCGQLRSKLYLRPDRVPNYFSCRMCLELRYELQNINRRGGILAELSYRFNRGLKIQALWNRTKRKVYDNKVTKPFLRSILAEQKWLGTAAADKIEERLVAVAVRKP